MSYHATRLATITLLVCKADAGIGLEIQLAGAKGEKTMLESYRDTVFDVA